MRPRLDLRNLLGAMALGFSLLCSAPGLRVATAEDVARGVPLSLDGSAKTSCDVDDVPGVNGPAAVTSGALMARMQAAMEQELANGAEAPVVLNARGYNYQADRDPAQELRIIERELRGQ